MAVAVELAIGGVAGGTALSRPTRGRYPVAGDASALSGVARGSTGGAELQRRQFAPGQGLDRDEHPAEVGPAQLEDAVHAGAGGDAGERSGGVCFLRYRKRMPQASSA